ncbi:MAG TPA: tryptophan--tRNA ligase [bacterium]|nr:tryptophan--tRNA ligase [bacterium]
MKTLFSGIQPSGDIHIGNYLGAIRNWVRLLDKYQCIYCIVDYHAITIEYDVQEMLSRIIGAATVNIAAGLDPEKCILFRQSDVVQHTELAWVLNTVTPMGDLERMTQFKDKSRQHASNVNAGLFTYPVLMAADIMLYKAEAVPVGDDQIQHLELCREITRKFNNRFGEVFPEAQPLLSESPRILGLDGKSKMSKSLGNTISLVDSPELIREKLATAVTDENRKRRKDPGNPDVCNLFTMHKGFSTAEQLKWVDEGCRSASIGCLECKKLLADNMLADIAPIQERIAEFAKKPDLVRQILDEGARKCRVIAEKTMDEVHGVMGFK